jgi:hypothetical protein
MAAGKLRKRISDQFSLLPMSYIVVRLLRKEAGQRSAAKGAGEAESCGGSEATHARSEDQINNKVAVP